MFVSAIYSYDICIKHVGTLAFIGVYVFYRNIKSESRLKTFQ